MELVNDFSGFSWI